MSVTSPDEAFDELMAGNRRHTWGTLRHPRQTVQRRKEVAGTQHPMAIVIGCSDSRVPPEIVFDQGLGDLFVIRVAGHVVSQVVLGSAELAVRELGVGLVVVLGHSRCGAVTAAVDGAQAPGTVGRLIEAISPAVAEADGQRGDVVDAAARSNVVMAVGQLESSPILGRLASEGRLRIVGAFYDLESGKVDVIA